MDRGHCMLASSLRPVTSHSGSTPIIHSVDRMIKRTPDSIVFRM